MKKYIRSSNQNIIDILRIEIMVEAPVPVYSSISEKPEQRFFDERDDLIMTVYENLINDICYVCEANGLYFLNYGESESKNPDGTPSNSRYLDFCLTDQMDAGTVRLIFMLRVSDHKLKDTRKDGSDRKESVNRKMQSRLEYDAKELQEHNPYATGDLYPHERWIKVGGTMCPNYGAAINVIERMIAGYKQSAKSKESDGDTHEN
jgi:hypothetical protein